MMTDQFIYFQRSFLISAVLALFACGGDSDDDEAQAAIAATPQYQITLSNLTFAQPLSPAAVIIHQLGFQAWIDGQQASVALENLAEGGDNSMLLSEAANASQHIISISGTGVVAGGGSEMFELAVQADDVNRTYLTVATMLVNTNDAFTGVNAMNISNMVVGETRRYTAPVWDAGTEVNSETTGTIPGPADGGEGFNIDRSGDRDFIVFHPGVLTQDHGLISSVLNETHRFDNPAVSVTVTRIE